MSDNETRIADLENEIKHRDRRILELKREVDEAQTLIAEMREQVQDCNDLIDRWIEAFEMTLNDKGTYALAPSWNPTSTSTMRSRLSETSSFPNTTPPRRRGESGARLLQAKRSKARSWPWARSESPFAP
jgi:uncharacterized coiled-coil protein SlyX